ncbi:MAG TPA: hypothetical protein VLL25_12125 [Acidimicrobiales bacterium]|nr:hypothetical protein [Acidimicrobiales bacterium]
MNAIPRASTSAHLRENRDSLGVDLSEAHLAELDAAFRPPSGPRALEML